MLSHQKITRENCLQVGGISPRTSYEKLYARLSACGLLKQLQLHQNNWGQFALAHFYSRAECESCRQQLDGCMLDERRLNVQRLNREFEGKLRGQGQPLKVCQAIDVANHFLGPTGWSHSVETLECQALRRAVPPALTAEAQYRARVHVSGTGFHVTAEADGWATSDNERPWTAQGNARKAAISNALRMALSKMAIVRLASGKTLVQILQGTGSCAAEQEDPSETRAQETMKEIRPLFVN